MQFRFLGYGRLARSRYLLAFATRRQMLLLCLAIISAVATGLIPPVLAILLGRIFDSFGDFGNGQSSGHDLRSSVTRSCIHVAILGSASMSFNFMFFASWLLFGEAHLGSAQSKIFAGLSTKRMSWFDMRASGVEALVPRMQSQMRELQLASSQPIGFVVQYIVTCVASLGVALYYSWKLTFVILSTTPLMAIIGAIITSRTETHIVSQQNNLTEASRNVANAISNIEAVKYFNAQEVELSKYAKCIRSARRQYLKQAWANALQMGIVQFMGLAIFVQGFWYGYHLFSTGQVDAKTILTTFWSCLTAAQIFQEILPHFTVLQKGIAAGAALRNMAMPQDDFSPGAQVNTNSLQCESFALVDIEFQQISFTYPSRPHMMVLTDFSARIPPGQITFMIGASGSGKSTVGQLLVKLYSPLSGKISLNGIDLQAMDINSLRKNITLVEQSSAIFDGTLRENISLGDTDGIKIGIGDIQAAATFALLQRTIDDLPDGFDSYINAKRIALSHGQRQRIALARARLRDTPVLILDESTSALDQISRTLIMAAVRVWREHKTTIIISHDLTQIQDNDFVIVLKDGQNILSGKKKDLAPINLLSHSTSLDDKDLPSSSSNVDSVSPISAFEKDMSGASPSSLVSPVERTIQINVDRVPCAAEEYPGHWFSPQFHSQRKMSKSRGPRRESRFSMSSWFSKAKAGIHALPRDDLQLVEKSGTRAAAARSKSGKLKERSGAALIDVPSDPDHKLSYTALPLKKILRTIWPTLSRQHCIWLLLGFASAVTHAATVPLFSYVFSKLLSAFTKPQSTSTIATRYSLFILLISAVDGIACFAMHFLLEKVGSVWVDHIRQRAVERILDQPKHFFSLFENTAASLSSELDHNAEEMRNILGRFTAIGIMVIMMTAMALLWSLAVCWKLTLAGFAIAPVSFFIVRAYQKVSTYMEQRRDQAFEAATAIMSEACSSIRTVKVMCLEAVFLAKHTQAVENALRVGQQRALYCGIFYGLSESTMLFAGAVIFYYGAILVSSGQYGVSEVTLVFAMLLFTMTHVAALVSFMPQVQQSRTSATRVLSLSTLPHDSHEHDGTLPLPLQGDIDLRHLTFAYPNEPKKSVLRNVNLQFAAGTCTAIVGASGSGKSTLTSLLTKLYPTSAHPTRPMLSLGGRDFNRLHTPSVRDAVTVVPQTPLLFPASVASNITYGLALDHPFTNLANVRTAARAAGIDEFIVSLPSGYDTMIGDGGLSLSGGQAQRLAIARALLRHPRILILDEPTSALDGASAEQIRVAIRNVRVRLPDITIIMVTHAREMMEIAERVVVMETGSVMEQGLFKELVSTKGSRLARLLRGGKWDKSDATQS